MSSVLGNVFDHWTVKASERVLKSMLDGYELCDRLPTRPAPAKTLRTAARRLGLLVDDYIRQIPVCTACFKAYTAEEILKLAGPSCTQKRCKGIVYRIKRQLPDDDEDNNNGDGEASVSGSNEKRIPAKIQPYYPLVSGLRRMLMRPDFVGNLVPMAPYVNPEPRPTDVPMRDFHDGSRFGQLLTGMKRIVQPDGSVADVEIYPGSQRKLAECEVGLSICISVDW